jgi:hypothetical protein
MNLEKRLQLVNALGESAGKIYTGVEVARIRAENDGVVVTTRTQVDGASYDWDVLTKCAIIATGRLGAIRLLGWMSAADFVFRRIEVGVRLEQQQGLFFLRESRNLDPKFIGDDGRPNVQWRTFCCCRGGEVVEVLSDGILAVSGWSDSEPTGLSNVAFHLRMTNPAIGNDVCARLLSRLEQHPQAFSLLVEDIRTDAKVKPVLVEVFGSDAASELFSGLCRLADQFAIRGPVTIHGPSVEGVAGIPMSTKDFACQDTHLGSWGCRRDISRLNRCLSKRVFRRYAG